MLCSLLLAIIPSRSDAEQNIIITVHDDKDNTNWLDDPLGECLVPLFTLDNTVKQECLAGAKFGKLGELLVIH